MEIAIIVVLAFIITFVIFNLPSGPSSSSPLTDSSRPETGPQPGSNYYSAGLQEQMRERDRLQLEAEANKKVEEEADRERAVAQALEQEKKRAEDERRASEEKLTAEQRALAEAEERRQRVLRQQAEAAAEASYNQANRLVTLGDLEGAVQCYEQAISLTPNKASFYNNLASTYKLMGDTERALENYRKAVSLEPNYAKGYLSLGNLLAVSGGTESAILSYKTFIKLARAGSADFNPVIGGVHQTGNTDLQTSDIVQLMFEASLTGKPPSEEIQIRKIFSSALVEFQCDLEKLDVGALQSLSHGIERPVAVTADVRAAQESIRRAKPSERCSRLFAMIKANDFDLVNVCIESSDLNVIEAAFYKALVAALTKRAGEIDSEFELLNNLSDRVPQENYFLRVGDVLFDYMINISEDNARWVKKKLQGKLREVFPQYNFDSDITEALIAIGSRAASDGSPSARYGVQCGALLIVARARLELSTVIGDPGRA